MMEYCSTTRKKEIFPFATTWLELEGIILSETSQIERQILYELTYLFTLKKERKKNKFKLIETKLKK